MSIQKNKMLYSILAILYSRRKITTKIVKRRNAFLEAISSFYAQHLIFQKFVHSTCRDKSEFRLALV